MADTGSPGEDGVGALRDRLHGDLLNPDDEGYEGARTVFNAMTDRYPSYVVRATGAANVLAAVDFTSEPDLLLSVTGGGHNVAWTAVCDDGLTIDALPLAGADRRRDCREYELGFGRGRRRRQGFHTLASGGIADEVRSRSDYRRSTIIMKRTK